MLHHAQTTDPIHGLSEALAAERPRLARLCQRLTGESAAAEDLTQETLLTAWRLRERITAPEGLSAWLAAIARNHARRWARARGGERARLVPLPGDDNDLSFAVDDACDPLEAIEREEVNELARRALALAPQATRDLLAAIYLAEATPTDAARARGLSDGALRVRLTRARQALRQALGADATLRAELEDAGLTLPAADGWTATRIWCPFCGASFLRAWVDRETGSYVVKCANGCAGGAVAGGARNLALVNAVSSPKSLIARHCLVLETGYRQALARGWEPCECGGRWAFRGVMPEDAPPGWPATHGLLGVCARCGRMDNSTAWHLALDTTATQRFWRRYPRMRALPMTGVEHEGRAAVVTGFAAVGADARIELVSDARDYTVLKTSISHAG